MSDPFESALATLVEGLRTAFADDLVAVVLFGSAAENRRRAVSDTNIAVVLRRFDPARVASGREVVALAQIALRLRLMLLRADELPAAATAFAVKFSDIQRRQRVLFGADPFAAVPVPRAAAVAQLRQALLNLVLRLREQWLTARDDRHRGEAAAAAAGGLRACAAELLVLEGGGAPDPRAALEQVAGAALPELSAARAGTLSEGAGDALLVRLLALAESMRGRVESLA
jgi:hypothetical protein